MHLWANGLILEFRKKTDDLAERKSTVYVWFGSRGIFPGAAVRRSSLLYRFIAAAHVEKGHHSR
jgi:hypothetical protein